MTTVRTAQCEGPGDVVHLIQMTKIAKIRSCVHLSSKFLPKPSANAKLFIGHDALQKIDVNTDRSDVQMTCKPDANVCKICEAFGFRPTGCLSSFGGSAWWPEFVSPIWLVK